MKTAEKKNPFRASNTTGGAIPFFHREKNGLEESGNRFFQALIEEFLKNQRSGQIFGPHGSGKTTLLENLIPLLEKEGFSVLCVSLHDQQRKLPAFYREEIRKKISEYSRARNAILVVDGYEQLGFFSRLLFRYYRVVHGFGRLLTAHRKIPGIPVLFRTRGDFGVLRCVLEHLSRSEWVDEEKLRLLFVKHSGNVRMILLDLYDIFEEQREIP